MEGWRQWQLGQEETRDQHTRFLMEGVLSVILRTNF
jgi:hypothetical protein